MLKSKIHRATVTDSNLNYVGSITIDQMLLKAADILENEKVMVVNINSGSRFETYAITGAAGKGDICLNGAAARLAQPGDKIIILSFGEYSDEELIDYNSKVIHVDDNNTIK